MKKILLGALALVLSLPLNAESAGLWTEDWEAALKQARTANKDLLVDFTGSDWCIWCQKLEAEVFSRPAFVEKAPRDFILVRLDFPQRQPQKAEVRARNARLAEEFGIEGYPTILLLDPQGRVYGRTGYQEGGAEDYLKNLAELKATKERLYAVKTRADKAPEAEKPALLDEFYRGLSEEGLAAAWADIPQAILKLDAKNKGKAGSLYWRYNLLQEFDQLKAGWNDTTNFPLELPKLDDLAARTAAPKDVLKANPVEAALLQQQVQNILVIKAAIQYRMLADGKKAVETLRAAINAAPESYRVAEIRQMISTVE